MKTVCLIYNWDSGGLRKLREGRVFYYTLYSKVPEKKVNFLGVHKTNYV